MNTKLENLEKWDTPLYDKPLLANLCLRTSPNYVEAEIEDLKTNHKYTIQWRQVLGFRFEDAFNAMSIMNTFILSPSDWIDSMNLKPFLTKDLTDAKHYILSFMDGRLDVVALREPEITERVSSKGVDDTEP